MTDTDGGFLLDMLIPGTYTVRAFRRGGGEGLVARVASGASVTVIIRPTGSIAGVIEADGGLPDELTVRVSERASGYSRSESFHRTGGRFVLRDLPPGLFDVAVSAAEGNATAQAQLASGQDLTGLLIRLVGRARVTGRLLAFDGSTPLSGYFVHVAAHEPNGGYSFQAGTEVPPRSGADGRFVVEGAPAGLVHILAQSGQPDASSGEISRPAMLAPGRTTDLGDLRARPRPGARVGDLGFVLAPLSADVDPAEASWIVAAMRPGGPAATSGLQVGDTIVSVDGYDVRGEVMSFHELTTVAPGTSVTLGLGRGASVRVTAAESP